MIISAVFGDDMLARRVSEGPGGVARKRVGVAADHAAARQQPLPRRFRTGAKARRPSSGAPARASRFERRQRRQRRGDTTRSVLSLLGRLAVKGWVVPGLR